MCLAENTKLLLLIDLLVPHDRTFTEHLNLLNQQGFNRLLVDGQQVKIEDLIEFHFQPTKEHKIYLIIDRISTQKDEAFLHRLGDAVELAFLRGKEKLF